MIKKSHTRYGLTLLALAAIATSSMGCRSSGFSMPKMKMFSWNRTPDAATLAGNTRPAGLPESPAAKYDPSAIASAKGNSNSTSAGSVYGYGATGNATAAIPGVAAQPGLAASANGYQTGPYQLAPKTATTPATSVASTATTGTLPGGSLPSPYGGTYTGSSSTLQTSPNTGTTAKTDIPLPSSVTAALNKGTTGVAGSAGSGLPALPGATAGMTSLSTPALPAGYANNPSGQTPASTSAYQMMPSPPAYAGSNPYAPSIPTATVGSLGGASTGTSIPPAPSALTTGLPAFPNQSSTAAASSAYQGATTLGTVYSPGSTGRSTSYDFSGGQGATTASSTSPATSYPVQAAPNSGTQPLLR